MAFPLMSVACIVTFFIQITFECTRWLFTGKPAIQGSPWLAHTKLWVWFFNEKNEY